MSPVEKGEPHKATRTIHSFFRELALQLFNSEGDNSGEGDVKLMVLELVLLLDSGHPEAKKKKRTRGWGTKPRTYCSSGTLVYCH